MSDVFNVSAELWPYPGKAAWHFVTLPNDLGEKIAAKYAGRRRGFGSLKVRVSLGSTTWDTSIFPDNKSGSFLLPVKSAVRAAENIDDGQLIHLKLELI